MIAEQVDVIVRFHDVRRLNELDRCIFSLSGQSHRPLSIFLVLQRFSESAIAATQEALSPQLSLPGAPELTIINLEDPTPEDARTVLLNKGLRATRGRYVAFLDYDDLLYPEAYSLLISRLRATDATIVFASVRVVSVQALSQFLYIRKVVEEPFGRGKSLVDLFEGNFCPLHSFMLDSSRIDPRELVFDASLTWEEDYDFLLRICARYPADFHLVDRIVGDYYWKDDGSNTVANTAAMKSGYDKVAARIETRRRTTYVSPRIQKAAGVRVPHESITIRELIDTVRGR
jgi:hypothetical protein